MYTLKISLESSSAEGPVFEAKATAEDGGVIIDTLTATANLMNRHLDTSARD